MTDPGAFLKQWRTYRLLSQKHLAMRVGTQQSHISDIESGASDPQVGTLARILDSMGLELVLIAQPKEKED